jgi:hypothetical protein
MRILSFTNPLVGRRDTPRLMAVGPPIGDICVTDGKSAPCL